MTFPCRKIWIVCDSMPLSKCFCLLVLFGASRYTVRATEVYRLFSSHVKDQLHHSIFQTLPYPSHSTFSWSRHLSRAWYCSSLPSTALQIAFCMFVGLQFRQPSFPLQAAEEPLPALLVWLDAQSLTPPVVGSASTLKMCPLQAFLKEAHVTGCPSLLSILPTWCFSQDVIITVFICLPIIMSHRLWLLRVGL